MSQDARIMRYPWKRVFWTGDGHDWPSPSILLLPLLIALAILIRWLGFSL